MDWLRIGIRTGAKLDSGGENIAAHRLRFNPAMAKQPTRRKSENSAVAEMPGPDMAETERGRIERRAYELYVARGGEAGRELDDWFSAERELTGEGEDRSGEDPREDS